MKALLRWRRPGEPGSWNMRNAQSIVRIPTDSPDRAAAEEALSQAETNVRELHALRGLVGDEEAGSGGAGDQAAGNEGSDLRDIPWTAKLVDKWTANPSLMLYKLQADAY